MRAQRAPDRAALSLRDLDVEPEYDVGFLDDVRARRRGEVERVDAGTTLRTPRIRNRVELVEGQAAATVADARAAFEPCRSSSALQKVAEVPRVEVADQEPGSSEAATRSI